MMNVPARLPALIPFLIVAVASAAPAQQDTGGATAARTLLLVPDAVWDGVADAPQRGWVVLVRGTRIEAVGPAPRAQPMRKESSCQARRSYRD
jgi:hypothetical protein